LLPLAGPPFIDIVGSASFPSSNLVWAAFLTPSTNGSSELGLFSLDLDGPTEAAALVFYGTCFKQVLPKRFRHSSTPPSTSFCFYFSGAIMWWRARVFLFKPVRLPCLPPQKPQGPQSDCFSIVGFGRFYLSASCGLSASPPHFLTSLAFFFPSLKGRYGQTVGLTPLPALICPDRRPLPPLLPLFNQPF